MPRLRSAMPALQLCCLGMLNFDSEGYDFVYRRKTEGQFGKLFGVDSGDQGEMIKPCHLEKIAVGRQGAGEDNGYAVARIE